MKNLTKPLNLILASTRDLGIGFNNNLPWPYLKRDLNFFKTTTTGNSSKTNTVIMGMNTFASMNYNKLKGRINLVITSKTQKQVEKYISSDVMFFNTLEEALSFSENCQKIEENFIIGGAKIFDYVLERQETFKISKLFWTRIFQDFSTDTKINKSNFEKLKKTLGPPQISKTMVQNDSINYDFNIYGQKFHNPVFKKSEEYQYIQLLEKLLKNGEERSDRTGTGTLGLFGTSMRYDLSQSFPLLTTKAVYFKGVVEELLWFIKGQTDARILKQKGVDIWNGNGSREFLNKRGLYHYREMDLGPVYGFQWRHFGGEYINCDVEPIQKGVDQLKNVLTSLKDDPFGRRHIVSAWNPLDLDKMALPPCHVMFQFYVDNTNCLSCSLYQRSCDVGLGLPFNIASYSLLTILVADLLGFQRGEFVHFIGDTHIYKNHVEALEVQLRRRPRPFPVLNIRKRKRKGIEDYEFNDFELLNYFPQKSIKMDMAV